MKWTIRLTHFLIALAVGCSLGLQAQSKLEKVSMIIELKQSSEHLQSMFEEYLRKYRDAFASNQTALDMIEGYHRKGQRDMLDSIAGQYSTLLNMQQLDAIIQQLKTGKINSSYVEMLQGKEEELANAFTQSFLNWARINIPSMELSLGKIIRADKSSIFSIYDPDEVFKKLEPYVLSVDLNQKAEFLSKKYKFKIYYDKTLWRVVNCEMEDPVFEVCFESLDGDLWTSVLVESNKMDLHKLKAAALYNLRQDSTIVTCREVGLVQIGKEEVLKMELVISEEGYDDYMQQNYYLTPSWGTMQVVTGCPKDVTVEDQKSIDNLAAGLKFLK